MTWVALIKAVLDFLNGLFASIRARKDEELGRLREREKQDAANDALRDAIDRANVDSVPDDTITR